MWNTQQQAKRLKFALVIEEADSLRNSIVELLRERGWLVHGINRVEQAFVILAHIPYNLIVLDSELAGINGMDFVRIMQNSRDWYKIDLIVIANSRRAGLAREIGESDAFLARRSMWRDDLCGFLSTYGGDTGPSNAYMSDVRDQNGH